MDEMQQDGLVEINEDGIFLTEIGKDFTEHYEFLTNMTSGKSWEDRNCKKKGVSGWFRKIDSI